MFDYMDLTSDPGICSCLINLNSYHKYPNSVHKLFGLVLNLHVLIMR